MRDFNAKLGKKRDDTENNLHNYGYGIRTEGGERLL